MGNLIIPSAYVLAGAIYEGLDDLNPNITIKYGSSLYPNGWLITVSVNFPDGVLEGFSRVPNGSNPDKQEILDESKSAIASIRESVDEHYLELAKKHHEQA